MSANTSGETPVYQIKISLQGLDPPIWRRIQVGGDTTLDQLHQILQVVMGWTDSHLHQFEVEGDRYGVPDPDWGDGAKDERGIRLSDIVAGAQDRIIYEYDFGDSWRHEILVEDVLSAASGSRIPICLAGEHACPPEDVGGVLGYVEFVQAIWDSEHPEHDEMLAWVGRPFDPMAFDLEAVNERLR